MRAKFLPIFLVVSLCASATPAQGEIVSPSMKLIKTINGSISPKSVRSSGDGVVSAHNMMYRHSVTVYDAKTFELLHTIPDSVSLKDFGASNNSGTYKGAPVEGSFSQASPTSTAVAAVKSAVSNPVTAAVVGTAAAGKLANPSISKLPTGGGDDEDEGEHHGRGHHDDDHEDEDDD